jgi:hypothetical protein
MCRLFVLFFVMLCQVLISFDSRLKKLRMNFLCIMTYDLTRLFHALQDWQRENLHNNWRDKMLRRAGRGSTSAQPLVASSLDAVSERRDPPGLLEPALRRCPSARRAGTRRGRPAALNCLVGYNKMAKCKGTFEAAPTGVALNLPPVTKIEALTMSHFSHVDILFLLKHRQS